MPGCRKVASETTLVTRARRVALAVFDFDGVFTDNRVLVLEDGTEGVMCSRADGIGLAALRELGIESWVLSSEPNPVVEARCRKLKLRCIHGVDDKASVLKKEAARRGIALERISFMGNDVNDLGCLRIVGFPACVRDAHPQVLAAAAFVSREKGGWGAVRELCEFIAGARRGAARRTAARRGGVA